MRVIVLDPSLEHIGGHHIHYNKTLISEFVRRGIEVKAVVNASFTAADLIGCEIISFFSKNCYPAIEGHAVSAFYDVYTASNTRLLAELMALPDNLIAPDDLILVHTTSEYHLAAFVEWAARFQPGSTPFMIILLMLPSGVSVSENGNAKIQNANAALFYRIALREAQKNERIKFFATGHQHAREYSFLADYAIESHPLITGIAVPPAEAERGTSVLLYAGDAKINKGIRFLKPLVEFFCENFPDRTFLAHVNDTSAWGDVKEAALEVEQLSSRFSNFRCVRGSITSEIYADMLQQCSIIVLSYDPIEYEFKSSGVLWESIQISTRIVLPANTWLSREAEYWGADFYEFSSWSIDGIADSISRALASDANGTLKGKSSNFFPLKNGVRSLVNTISAEWVPFSVFSGGDTEGNEIIIPASKICGQGWHEAELYAGSDVRWSSDRVSIDLGDLSSGYWSVEMKGLSCFDQSIIDSVSVAGTSLIGRPEKHLLDNGRWIIRAVLFLKSFNENKAGLFLALAKYLQPPGENRKLGLLFDCIVTRRLRGKVSTRNEQSNCEFVCELVDGKLAQNQYPISFSQYCEGLLISHKSSEIGCIFTLRPNFMGDIREFLSVFIDGVPVKMRESTSDDGLFHLFISAAAGSESVLSWRKDIKFFLGSESGFVEIVKFEPLWLDSGA